MSKHRLREDDDTALLPPTVEELARSERSPDRARPGRQPIIIGLATAALLVSGAGAWALVKPSGAPELSYPMTGPSASGGAGFVDGFGVMTPSPAPTSPPQPSHTAPPPGSPSAGASPSVAASLGGSPSAGASPGSSPVGAPPAGGGTGGALAATYAMSPWWKGFQLTVTIRNTGSAPADWRVRIKLPADAVVPIWAVWSTVPSAGPDNVWEFAPQNGGKLAPGASVSFGMTGTRTGTGTDFAVVSCTVDGGTCAAN
ncbi:hypothetical protein Cs7R123_30780 [Catellatospora sp. TT07R-123]|uniref:cellulose binding domain-containing protein n=1 Tax=Catellatospora sp. TT07R-123 TaxID=2733863 RepID=UPI001B2B7F3A|nr:cellulose binding domain-containing protein [Catellatospora sp. TT07R-123]GHJ45736.1 hypothetical protein Cs7R123_30780 [Catellatospora sp. TT07R-123]